MGRGEGSEERRAGGKTVSVKDFLRHNVVLFCRTLWN